MIAESSQVTSAILGPDPPNLQPQNRDHSSKSQPATQYSAETTYTSPKTILFYPYYINHTILRMSTQVATQPAGQRGRGTRRGGGRGRGGQGQGQRGASRGGGGGGGGGGGHHAQPKSQPPQSTEGTDADKAVIDRVEAAEPALSVDGEEVCFICAEPFKYYSVSKCNHRTCHVCALRLRALYKRMDCTFCKVCLYVLLRRSDRAHIISFATS